MELRQGFLDNGNHKEYHTLNCKKKDMDLNVETPNYSYKLDKKGLQNSIFKDLLKINLK